MKNEWIDGVVVRSLSSFHYVQTGPGAKVECRLRGRFRRDDNPIITGDRVRITPLGDGKGVIEEILPRKTVLYRPLVANVTQTLIVVAFANPPLDTGLIDRLLVLSEANEMDAVICVNKADLALAEQWNGLCAVYSNTGYPMVAVSAKTGDGVDELHQLLQGKTTVLAGPSGVGKSSLLNHLDARFQLKTGEVSERIHRGKHTTRCSELLELAPETFVVDSPGFGELVISGITKLALGDYFPEILRLNGLCKYQDCLHRTEPNCAIGDAVRAEQIHPQRYQHYLEMLDEIHKVPAWKK